MRTLALTPPPPASQRRNGVVTAVAVVRCFGAHFAEVPFVTAKKRGRGDGARLMGGLEARLKAWGVRNIVVSSGALR